jgi:YVTN family beta-propeller protein
VQLGELNGFAVIDFDKHQELTRIKFPDDEPSMSPGNAVSHGMGVAPDGKTLWVVSRSYNCAFVYSLPDLKLMGRAHLPTITPPGHTPISGAPNWVTFTPDGKTAYVANGADRSVSAVDVKTLKAVARIPTGEMPGRMGMLTLP